MRERLKCSEWTWRWNLAGFAGAVALVGHETFCYDDLTVAENVRFVARSTGHAAGDAEAAIDRVGLRRVADVAHGRLSQGQRRRLSLANALARKPRLLLLDEPHAGLDEHGRNVLEEVVAASAGDGCTVMLASHELDLARRLATREVRVVGGQVHPIAAPPHSAPPHSAPPHSAPPHSAPRTPRPRTPRHSTPTAPVPDAPTPVPPAEARA